MGRYYLSIPTIDNVDIPFSIMQKCKRVYETDGKWKVYKTLNESLDFSPVIHESTLLGVQNGGSTEAMNSLIQNRESNRNINLIKRYLYLYRAAMAQTISFAYNIDEYELTKKTKDFGDSPEVCPYCGEKLTVIQQMGNLRAYPVSYYDDVIETIEKEITYTRYPLEKETNVLLVKYVNKISVDSIDSYVFSGWYTGVKENEDGSQSVTGEVNNNNRETLIEHIDENSVLKLYALYTASIGGSTLIVPYEFPITAFSYFNVLNYTQNDAPDIPKGYAYDGWTVRVTGDTDKCPKIYTTEELKEIRLIDCIVDNKFTALCIVKGTSEETVPYGSTINESFETILFKPTKENYLFDKYVTIFTNENEEKDYTESLTDDISEYIDSNNIVKLKANYKYHVAEGTWAYDDKCYHCAGTSPKEAESGTYTLQGISHYGEICPDCGTVCSYKGYLVNGNELDLSSGLKVLIYKNGEWTHYSTGSDAGVIDEYIRDIASMNSLADYNKMVATPNGSICYDGTKYANKANQTLKIWQYTNYITDEFGNKTYIDPNYEQIEKKLLEYADEREDLYEGYDDKWVYFPNTDRKNTTVKLCPTDTTGTLKDDYIIEGVRKCFKNPSGSSYVVNTISTEKRSSSLFVSVNQNHTKFKTFVNEEGDYVGDQPIDVHLTEENWRNYLGWYIVIEERKPWDDPSDSIGRGKITSYRECEITEENCGISAIESGNTEFCLYSKSSTDATPVFKTSGWEYEIRPKLKMTLREAAYKWNLDPVIETAIKRDSVYYCTFTATISGNNIFDLADYTANNSATVVITERHNIRYASNDTNDIYADDPKTKAITRNVYTIKNSADADPNGIWFGDLINKYFVLEGKPFVTDFNEINASIYNGYLIENYITSSGEVIAEEEGVPFTNDSVWVIRGYDPETHNPIFELDESDNRIKKPYEKVTLIKPEYKFIDSASVLGFIDEDTPQSAQNKTLCPAGTVDSSTVVTWQDRDEYTSEDGIVTYIIYGGFGLSQTALYTSSDYIRTVELDSKNCGDYISTATTKYYHYTDYKVNDTITVKRPILITASYLKESGVYENPVTWDIIMATPSSDNPSVYDATLKFGANKIPMNAVEGLFEKTSYKTRKSAKAINVNGIIISGSVEDSENELIKLAESYGTVKVRNVPSEDEETGEAIQTEKDVPVYKIINDEGHVVNVPYLYDEAGNYLGNNPYYDPNYTGLNYAGWRWIGSVDESVATTEKGIIEAYPIKDPKYYADNHYIRVLFIEDYNSLEYNDSEGVTRSLIRYCANEHCYSRERIVQKSKWSYKGLSFSTANFPKNASGLSQKANFSLDEYMFVWRTRYELYNNRNIETGIKGYRYYDSAEDYAWKNYSTLDDNGNRVLPDGETKNFILNHAIMLHRGGGAYPDKYRFDFEAKYATNEYSENRFNTSWPNKSTWKEMFKNDLKSIIGTSYVPMGRWKDDKGVWHENEDLEGNEDNGRPIIRFQDDYKNQLFAIFETCYNQMINFTPYYLFNEDEKFVMEGIINDFSDDFKLAIVNFVESYNRYVTYITREWTRDKYDEKKASVDEALINQGLSFESISEKDFSNLCDELLSEYKDQTTNYKYTKMWYIGPEQTVKSLKNVLAEFHELIALPGTFMCYLLGFVTWTKYFILYFDCRGGVGNVNVSTNKVTPSSLNGNSPTVSRSYSSFKPKIDVLTKPYPTLLDDTTENGIYESVLLQFGSNVSDLRYYSFSKNIWLDKEYAGTQLKNLISLFDKDKIPLLGSTALTNESANVVLVYPYEDKDSYGEMTHIDSSGNIGTIRTYTGYSNLLFVRRDGLYRFNVYTNEFIKGEILATDLFTEKTESQDADHVIKKAIIDEKTSTIVLFSFNGEIASANLYSFSYCSSSGETSGDNPPLIHYNPKVQISSTENRSLLTSSKLSKNEVRGVNLLNTQTNEEIKDAIVLRKLGTLTPSELDEGEWRWKLINEFDQTPLLPIEISDEYFQELPQKDKYKYYINPKLTLRGAIERLGINEDEIPKEIEVDSVEYVYSNTSVLISGVSILPTQLNEVLTSNKTYYAVYHKKGIDISTTRYGYSFYLSSDYDTEDDASKGKNDKIVGVTFSDYLSNIPSIDDRFSKANTGAISKETLIDNITSIYRLDGFIDKVYIPCFAISNDAGQLQIIEWRSEINSLGQETGRHYFNIVLTLDYEDGSKVIEVKYIPNIRKNYIIYENQRITEVSTYQYLPRIYHKAVSGNKIKFVCDNFANSQNTISYFTESGDIVNITTNNTSSNSYEGNTSILHSPYEVLDPSITPRMIKEIYIEQIKMNKTKSQWRKYSSIEEEESVVKRN